MKKIVIVIGIALILILISIFLHYRFKTKRITSIIGASKFRVEEFLNYPNKYVQLDTIPINDVDPTIKEIILKHTSNQSEPLLRYTVAGSIRKHVYWLLWKEDDYYVIEAIDTNI